MIRKKTYSKPYLQVYEVDEVSSLVLLSPAADELEDLYKPVTPPPSGRGRGRKSVLSTSFSHDDEEETSGESFTGQSPF